MDSHKTTKPQNRTLDMIVAGTLAITNKKVIAHEVLSEEQVRSNIRLIDGHYVVPIDSNSEQGRMIQQRLHFAVEKAKEQIATHELENLVKDIQQVIKFDKAITEMYRSNVDNIKMVSTVVEL